MILPACTREVRSDETAATSDNARGGGKDATKLGEALQKALELIKAAP
jgi:hypothetical protein